jgi:hypothetical protein
MLTENDVVEAVAKYLSGRRYRIDRQRSTREQGIDIEALDIRTGRRLLIEAKGATSSKEGTNRYNKPFTRNQAQSHVAVALYCAARLRQEFVEEHADIALAFPDDGVHSHLVERISTSLKDLGIAVYFVSNDRGVRQF